MVYIVQALLICLFLTTGNHAQDDSTIAKIRDGFSKWQPLIESELHSADRLYHYVWGPQYDNETWTTTELENDDYFLYHKVSILEKPDLGTFVYIDQYTPSGDWYIVAEHYYDVDDKLYFALWRLNTFQADEPLTVEQRLYFNRKGEMIRQLKSVYKMNTKERSEVAFSERTVDYQLKLEDTEFYEAWKSTK